MGGSRDRRVRSRAVALGGLAHGAIMGVGSAIRRDQGGADADMTAGR
jgi:hypothetical protein